MILALNHLQQLNGNKMKSVISVLIFLITFSSCAQRYADIGEKEGRKFYIHKVEQSQSLYQISRTYDISIDELKSNNAVLNTGLQMGQTLWIPVRYDEIVHVVQRRETLYGISRKYSKPIDSIVAHNPHIKDGLNRGQELLIKNIIRPIKIENKIENPFSTNPEIKDTLTDVNLMDSLVEYTVHPGETLYSISRRFMVPMDTLKKRNNLNTDVLSDGQVLIIPLKKELEIKERLPMDSLNFGDLNLPNDSVNFNEKKKITVFLPFNLDTIDTKNVRAYAMEYYMGALLAIDSLDYYGVNADFHFIDYESIIDPYDSVLNNLDLIHTDLIFAPFNLEKATKLRNICRNTSVKIIYPLKNQNKLHDHPGHIGFGRVGEFFMEPTELSEYYTLARHLSQLDSVQLVFIKTTDSIERIQQNKFLEIYYNMDAPSKIIEANASNYQYFSNRENVNTVYIILSNDCEFIEEVFTFSNEKENVLIYGKMDWTKHCNYVSSLDNTKSFRYFNGSFLDYEDPRIKEIHRAYRRKFNSDLTKMSGIGFDATLNMVLALLYDIFLPQGLVYRFRFNYEGHSINHNLDGYIMSFDNLSISIVD